MKKYKYVNVSEKQLEDLVRQYANQVEEGLQYVDHQRMTDRGPLDVLFVDSGNALVVAELKVVEDDTMLVQGIDYYDYISRNVDAIAGVYKKFKIDPRQEVRLFLIAPSFSVTLLGRCAWIDISISLFSYQCITLKGSKEIIPVFQEITIPYLPDPPVIYTIEDRLNYITDSTARKMLENYLDEVKSWDTDKILAEPLMYDISAKVSGKVFAYFAPRRKHFVVYTYDDDDEWIGFPIHQKQDLESVEVLLKANVERLG